MPTDPTPVSPAPSRCQRIRAYRLLLALAILVFVLDQLTKLWIINRLPLGSYGPYESITVIPGFFYLVHVGNTGAAWSMLTGKSTLLAAIAIITLAGIYFFRSSLGLRDRLAQIAFGLLCGGIVGNLVDRIQHQHVVDFLDFHFGSYVYPTFNVADSAICVGVVLYLWHSFKTAPTAAQRNASQP
ncbi:MAG: signal peptidase II [Opitutaceae bacterium]|nr:signal peptidase II [Opitutaceae bacterium]